MKRLACCSAALLFTLSLTTHAQTVGDSSATPRPASSSAMGWLTMGNYNPYIEIGYALALPGHKLFTAEFPKIGAARVQLGYRELRPFKSWGFKLDDRFVLGEYGTADMPGGKVGTGGFTEEYWRVGAGMKDGYGWDFAAFDLVPHHQFAFNITRLEPDSLEGLSPADSALVTRPSGAIRFGMSTEAGVTTEFFGFLSASAGYEASVIYPRTVFPKWAGSYLLASSSIILISTFAEDIVQVSPFFGPILYFVMKNAVALAWAYAWRGDMNWPFPSETPLFVQTFRLHVGIRF